MDKRNVVLLFSVFLVLVVRLFGESGPPIYVSTNTGTVGQILRVVESADGKVAVTVVYTGTESVLPHPGDITVGPDKKIYGCDPTKSQIVRMDVDDNGVGANIEIVYDQTKAPTSQNPTGPQGPRFDSAGTLFFNTKTTLSSKASGVWKIDGLAAKPFSGSGSFPAPVNVLGPDPTGEGLGGEGLAFTKGGDLLVVKRSLGEVQCLQGPLNTCPGKITGLADPIGIAVNSVGEIFVARRSLLDGNAIQRFTPKGLPVGTYVNFDAADMPFFPEFTSDDTLFVATADATTLKGKLWRVDTRGSKTLLVDLATQTQIIQPAGAVGVGKPGTSKSITWTFRGTQVFDFGPNSFELTAGNDAEGPCTATITARQRPPAEVNQMLQDSCTMQGSCVAGTVQTMSGDEGWATTWLVEPDLVKGCPTAPDGNYGVAIFGFVVAPFGIRPGIVKCSSPTAEQADASLPVCVLQQDFGYYPEATTLLGPDPIIVTKSKSFSEYGLVNLKLDLTPGQNVYFWGPAPPFPSDPKKLPPVFSIGQTIPIKFQLTTGPNGTGSLITDANAVLTVAQIEKADGRPTFIRKVITPAGSANAPPVFRYDSVLNQYLFNLKSSKSTGWKAGLYKVNITSNKFFTQKPPPNPILFRLK